MFINLKEAFDTVNHNLLNKKFEMNVIRGIVLKWLVSYFKKGHNLSALIKSDLIEIVCGVPQGSTVGLKSFLLYINDLCNVPSIFKFVLFADDTNIFYSADNLELLGNTISQELNELHNCLAVNKLSLNINNN